VSPVAGSDPAAREADYARAGFGTRLGVGDRPALIVVDPVQAYLRPDSPLYAGVESAVAVASSLAGAARRREIPVVLTRVTYRPDGLDGGLFFRKVPALRAFVAGSPDGRFADLLDVAESDIVVDKQYASAFFGTSLAPTLRGLGIDTLVVTGLTTSGCVRATATDALNHGFRPLVVRDGVGDRDAAAHTANLFDLDQKSADVVDSPAVFELFESRWASRS
jgi:maleamate amidohydrolase